MRRPLSILAISLAVLGSQALAQPQQVASPAFNGFYAGADVGLDTYSFDSDIAAIDELDITGAVFGGHLGWRRPLSAKLVLGVELFVSGSTAEDTISSSDPAFPEDIQSDLSGEVSLHFGGEGQIGYLLSPRFLGYLGIGGVLSQVELSESVVFFDSVSSFSDEETVGGFRIGLGGEYAFSGRLSARLNANYHLYADALTNGGDLSGFQVTAGVNYSF